MPGGGYGGRAECDERSEHRAVILAEVVAAGRGALRRQAARSSPSHADLDEALQDACVDFLRYYDGPPGALPDAVRQAPHPDPGHSAATRYGAAVELTTTDSLLPARSQVAAPCERPGPLERAERREHARAVVAGLAELRPDERTALLLLGLGYAYREIAGLRGWTNTKVNRCLAEGRAALAAESESQPPSP